MYRESVLTLNVLCFLLLCSFSLSAQTIERKIIIKDSIYYFTTVDPETQVATLHTGNIADPPKNGKKLAIPAGRNFNEPENQFSWDICKKDLYAINFLNHPLNDRNEALKKMPLASLSEWNDKTKAIDLILKSVDENMFTYNAPYMALQTTSNTMNDFYYDGVAAGDTSYFLAYAANGEFCLWNYNERGWKQGTVQNFKMDGPFSLLQMGTLLYIRLSNGEFHRITMDGIIATPVGSAILGNVVVLNRDNNTIRIFRSEELDPDISVEKQIEKKSVQFFYKTNY